MTALGINAALGGLTAGLMREMRGGSFWEGAWPGMLGGGIGYMGKHVAAERFSGAGLIGRQVGAVGASVVQNASEGRAMFERLVMPLGPLRFYVETTRTPRVRAKLDLAGAVMVGWAVNHRGVDLMLAESVSSGAPVFAVDETVNGDWAGAHVAGVVLLRDFPGLDHLLAALPHERVHVLQYDQSFVLWSAPAEGALFSTIPGGGLVNSYLDLSLNAAVFGIFNVILPYDSRPWEKEAYMLSRIRPRP